MKTFVVSDIHGDYEGLISVMYEFVKSGFDISHDRIVFLGDYVDGYPRSREVVKYVRNMEKFFGKERVVCLRGNHEQLMISGFNKVAYDPEFLLWYRQGGKATAISYNSDLGPNDITLPVTDTMRDDVEWMKSLRYYYEDASHYYVHAGFMPGVEVEAQEPYTMIWIRDEFIYSDYDFGKMVVFGHSAVPEPIIHANKIQMDTRFRGKGYVSGAQMFPDKPPIFYAGPKDT